MSAYVWLVLGLAIAGWLGYRGIRIWQDTAPHGLTLPRRLGWAAWGALFPSRYWWDARIALLTPLERAALLDRETAALGLSRADSVRCPLCGTEILRAWALDRLGNATVARGPIHCPQCDFRLDACRHCTNFLPGSPQDAGRGWLADDLTFGRCGHYKATQPVEQTCTPEMARQLRARGMDTIRAPLPIVDSFMPPDFCRAFSPHRGRLKAGHVPWPDARRTALLRLLHLPAAVQLESETVPSGDDEWLL